MSELVKATVLIQTGKSDDAVFRKFEVEVDPAMVVLDVIHKIQATQAPDLAVRWNCKAGKCGSCSAEINGRPALMCMTRIHDIDLSEDLLITPLKTFPLIKDLVTDVSWNYEINKRIKPYNHPTGLDEMIVFQSEVERVKEFRKCIECFICQDVCHVLREHNRKDAFAGPRFMLRLANLEMHPKDTEDRLPEIKNEFGVGYCNITKCCTEVCPENIPITDEAIIPLKERVVSRYYDPLMVVTRFFKKIVGKA
ncbi:MAG: succinate dehydrogenase/fumarate reductase iron-sulfur subunit [Candidatus Kariarchaeaceae archaeon]|jgi:succinate dehydrogenase / fumarate reductase iron-sulfur subunit